MRMLSLESRDCNHPAMHLHAKQSAWPCSWISSTQRACAMMCFDVCWGVLLQLFWFVPLNQTYLITYNSSDIPREFVDNLEPDMSPAAPIVTALSSAGRRLFQGDTLKSTLFQVCYWLLLQDGLTSCRSEGTKCDSDLTCALPLQTDDVN